MYLENPPWRIARNVSDVKDITLMPYGRYSAESDKVTIKAKDIDHLEIVNTRTERLVIESDGKTKRYYDDKTKITGHVTSNKLSHLVKSPYSDICYSDLVTNHVNGNKTSINIPNDNTNGNLCMECDDVRDLYSSQDVILKKDGVVKLNFTSEKHNYEDIDDDY